MLEGDVTRSKSSRLGREVTKCVNVFPMIGSRCHIVDVLKAFMFHEPVDVGSAQKSEVDL